jgi:hypothetical protein
MTRKFKEIATLIFTVILFSQTFGQKSLYSKIKNYNLTSVYKPDSIIDDSNEKTKLAEPLGFIGANFQRFQIHFTSIKKNKTNPYEYDVLGKTKVNEKVCSFKGTFKVISAVFERNDEMKEIGFPLYKQATIKTKITLSENEKEVGTGIISGTLTTDVYLNEKGKLFYNALMFVADGFSNNQFEGQWTSYKANKTKKCNWGDYRIPQCDWQNGCDIGAGEFSISDKYLKNGWENYRLAWNSDPEKPEVVKARKKEEEHWWK